jgi:hypothetical protein
MHGCLLHTAQCIIEFIQSKQCLNPRKYAEGRGIIEFNKWELNCIMNSCTREEILKQRKDIKSFLKTFINPKIDKSEKEYNRVIIYEENEKDPKLNSSKVLKMVVQNRYDKKRILKNDFIAEMKGLKICMEIMHLMENDKQAEFKWKNSLCSQTSYPEMTIEKHLIQE